MQYQHRRKAIEGEAVQFTEDGKNDSLIASWFAVHPQRVKEVKALSAHTVSGAARRVERGSGPKRGDWLIRTKSGGLYVCPEADFEDHYVKVESYEKRKKTDAE